MVFKLKLEKPCAVCTGYLDKNGYGRCKYKGKTEQAHRVAYAEANGLTMEDIKGVIIRHKCDNPPCAEPTHLVAGTLFDNMRDMWQRHRARPPCGEQHWKTNLTIAQVSEIKQKLAEGQGCTVLAAEYGVSRLAISHIKAGRSWKYIQALGA
ncbi:hypothetical protein ADM96_15635 [Burkholderia sp. ST111]|nr:hypothetical protein ADM96_15635 [Burkholderia sp. ST111]